MSVRAFPSRSFNSNVPRNVFVVAEVCCPDVRSSTAVEETHYIDSEGNIWVVGGKAGEVRKPSYMSTLCRLSGGIESEIQWRFEQWTHAKGDI